MRTRARRSTTACWLGAVVATTATGCFDSHTRPTDLREPDPVMDVPGLSPSAPTAGRGSTPSAGGDGEPSSPEPDPAVTPMPDEEPPAGSDVVLFHVDPRYSASFENRFVGDLDGDGFDDFLMLGIEIPTDPTRPDLFSSVIYVFYGRASFPSEVDLASADAVLRGAPLFPSGAVPGPARPLGDLDGDGLADFVVAGTDSLQGGSDWLQFVLGDRERLSGEHAIEDVGVRWSLPRFDAAPAAPFGSTRVTSAGDFNGDGLDDLAITLTTGVSMTVTESSVSYSPVDSVFLVMGREDWPSGTFDPSLANLRLSSSNPDFSCSAMLGADLDGDGFTDLVVSDNGNLRRFAGEPGTPAGTDVTCQDGELLQTFGTTPRWLRDLDEDSREELGWSSFTNQMAYLTYGGQESAPNSLGDGTVAIMAPDMPLGGYDVADFNGDGHPDLIASAGMFGVRGGGLYVVPGNGRRLPGTLALGPEHLVLDAGERGLPGSFGLGMQAGGDVNGDGFADVLALVSDPEPAPTGTGSVALVFGHR